MLTREAMELVRRRLTEAPAVALVGPRQSGKTTLARATGALYYDLEQDGDRLRLDLAWGRVSRGDGLVVLDEAQAFPEVFARLRAAIDADRRRCGRFLLLGSISPALMRSVAESLAGRMALVELTPLLLGEVGPQRLDDLWLRGGYPDGGILGTPTFGSWQRDYLRLLAQRDLPQWGLPARPQVTDRLFRMVAAVHGQQWNASQIGQSLGLSHTTVNSYMDYLEGAFLVRCLRPYQANLTKRLTRRPRYYWRDSGLLHALLRVSSVEDLLGQPWVGASWEGFVLEQLQATAALRQPGAEAWFFRTSDGYEADLVLELGRERWAVEVKLTSMPTTEDLRRLTRVAEMLGATRQALVCRIAQPMEDDRRLVCSLPELLRRLGPE